MSSDGPVMMTRVARAIHAVSETFRVRIKALRGLIKRSMIRAIPHNWARCRAE
jgi:hypothetical protein